MAEARNEQVAVRLNEKEKRKLEMVKEILDLDGAFGGDSKAIRRALSFFIENHDKAVQDFKGRYGNEEIARIKEAIKKGRI